MWKKSVLPTSSTGKISSQLKILPFVLLIFIISFKSYSYEDFGVESDTRFDLMLAGGGLKTCSSMSTKNCTKKSFFDQSKTELLYQVTANSRKKLRETQPYTDLSDKNLLHINAVIEDMYSSFEGETFTRRRLADALKRHGHYNWYRDLSDPLYYALMDSLEAPQFNAQGDRLKEKTSLVHNRNRDSEDIYRAFVAQASLRVKNTGSKPILAVVTASSRDPFEAADFYESVFNDAGAEVVWLPLDIVYQHARQKQLEGQKGCDELEKIRQSFLRFHRESVYPDRAKKQRTFCHNPQRMLNAIQSVQGIFFNGGDQSLTLAALKTPDGIDSPELTLIKQRMHEGHLIVGGTSAGTAVQAGGAKGNRPVPMLTNGHSDMAMKRGAFATPAPSQRCAEGHTCETGLYGSDLTYNATGGTGLFTLGLLDTHFSERDREIRLSVFTDISGQELAFGVDEATALFVRNARTKADDVAMSVLGQGGVFIVDRRVSHYLRANTPERIEVSLGAVSHYLGAGSHATYSAQSGAWQFALAGNPVDERHRLKALEKGEWRDHIRRYCGAYQPTQYGQFDTLIQLKPGTNTRFAIDQDNKHCSYQNLPYVLTYLMDKE